MDVSEDWGEEVRILDSANFIIPTMTLYGLFSAVGTIANIVIICTIVFNKRLHTVTNVFIAQLAIGDLVILLFCMPFTVTAVYLYRNWVFGRNMCYLVKFAGSAGPTITVLVLAVMSYERYFGILKPFEAQTTWTKCKVVLVSLGVYVIAAARSMLRPLLGNIYREVPNVDTGNTTNKTGEIKVLCGELPGSSFSFWYHLIGIAIFYVLVIVTIIVLYVQVARHLKSQECQEMIRNNPQMMSNRKRVVVMISIIIVSFALCWLPVNIVLLLHLTPNLTVFVKTDAMIVFIFIARLFEYGNCVINPFLYSFLSPKFKSAFLETWSKMFPCLRSIIPDKSRSGSVTSSKSRLSSVISRSSRVR